VILLDISLHGARVEHAAAIPSGSKAALRFDWEGLELAFDCLVIRTPSAAGSADDDLTFYESGLEFDAPDGVNLSRLKQMVATHISRTLAERRLNMEGGRAPEPADDTPIFRIGGMVDAPEGEGEGESRRDRRGYICYRFDQRQWRRKRTRDPGQPPDGFTVSAAEDNRQIDLLREAYEQSDAEGRRMIQTMARLSISEGNGAV
jgi:hypothetical protein